VSRIVSAADVEAAAAAGRDRITVPAGGRATPLAVDRAAELGVRLEQAAARPAPGGRERAEGLETTVRTLVRRVMARIGADPAAEDRVVTAVLRRLGEHECACGKHR